MYDTIIAFFYSMSHLLILLKMHLKSSNVYFPLFCFSAFMKFSS